MHLFAHICAAYNNIFFSAFGMLQSVCRDCRRSCQLCVKFDFYLMKFRGTSDAYICVYTFTFSYTYIHICILYIFFDSSILAMWSCETK